MSDLHTTHKNNNRKNICRIYKRNKCLKNLKNEKDNPGSVDIVAIAFTAASSGPGTQESVTPQILINDYKQAGVRKGIHADNSM